MKNYCKWCHQANSSVFPQLKPNLTPARQQPQCFNCPDCQREITLIDVETAAILARKSTKTIRHLAKSGKIKAMRAGKSYLICASSLFAPAALLD